MAKLTGRIVSGFDEGAFFMRKYESRIKAATGFSFFPGTLNIECEVTEAGRFLEGALGVKIAGFEEEGRYFGGITLYPVKANGIGGFVIKPEKNKYDDSIVEVIAAVNLKQKLGLKNGDSIELER
ncbi:MAG: DUF120 domain-containing protein [Candidatus Micrarchaeota archaeon]